MEKSEDKSLPNYQTILLNENETFKNIKFNKVDSKQVDFLNLEQQKILIDTNLEFDVKDKKKTFNLGVVHQLMLTCSIVLLACACGGPIGYSSVILPQLINANDSLSMDYEMGSWIASIHSAATPVGSLISVPMMNRYGRKFSLLFSILPLVTGWIIIALANSHFLILLGRVVAGISVGLLGAPAQILLAEISQPNIRGALIGIPFMSYSCGILIIYGLGSIFNWRTVAWSSLLLPVVSFFAISLAPESPTWLARQGLYDKAQRSLSWLRGGDHHAKEEFNQLIEQVEKEKQNHFDNQKSEAVWFKLRQVRFLKPLILINVFSVLQILSGTYLIVFYAVDIITEICNFGDNFEITSMQSAVLTALIRLILATIYCFLLMKCKRRSIYLTSALFSGLTSFILALFLYYKHNEEKSLSDLIFIAIVLLCYISANTSFIVIPGILVGELLPLQIRHWSGMLFTFFNITMFGVAKIFPLLKQTIKSHGLFLMFSISSLLAFILFHFLLPESQNRSLKDIEEYYQQPNWLWQNRNKKPDRNDKS